jgi:hypothetical protein
MYFMDWDPFPWSWTWTLFCIGAYWNFGAWILRKFFKKVSQKVVDVTNYIYIPYTVGTGENAQDRYLTIRRPNGVVEWAFVAGFVGVMSGLVYKLISAASCQKQVEARKHLVTQYQKYMRLAIFSVVFPAACNNSADEIVAFVGHVGNYYRQVMGVTDLLLDAGSVISDVSSLFGDLEVESSKFAGCQHHSGCPDYHKSNWPKPCDTFCGGHHCIHHPECTPSEQEVKSSPERCTQANDIIIDNDYEMDSDNPSDEDIDDDVKEVSENDMSERRRESSRRFDELMRQQEEAIARLQSGRSRQGLGFDPFHRQPSGVWKRVKSRVMLWYASFSAYCAFLYTRLVVFCVKYQWWIAGGASLVAITGVVVAVYKCLPKLKYAEGGKKRKKPQKKEKADRRRARDETSSRRDVDHPTSGGDGGDKDFRFKTKEEEERIRRRDEQIEQDLTKMYGTGRFDYESKKFISKANTEGKFFKDMTRSELLGAIRYWKDRDCPAKAQQDERRRVLSALFSVLQEKYPRDKKPAATPPAAVVEHLRPGSIPFATPRVYLVNGSLRGVGQVSTCFTYADGVYVPRHLVAAADKIVFYNGGHQIELPGKGVLVKDRPDLVMFPLPAGVSQNTGMKFRAPKEGEIATLFYVRQVSPTQVHQTVGVVGKTIRLGSDKSLSVVEYSASSEKGSCGGLYIAASDGYCIGYHGIGSDDVAAKPLFYPMEENWYEKAKQPGKQIATYVPVEDVNYQDKIHAVINNKISYESLNF